MEVLNFDVSVASLQSQQFDVARLFKEERTRQALALAKTRLTPSKSIFAWLHTDKEVAKREPFLFSSSPLAFALRGDHVSTRGTGFNCGGWF